MATRPLGGIGNTGITGGIKGLDNAVPVAKTETKKETKAPPDAMGGQVTSTAKLEGSLNPGAAQTHTHATASSGALWGDDSPKAKAQAMVDFMTRLAKTAESGGDVAALAKQFNAEFNGHDPATRAAVDVLWTPEGSAMRAQIEAATARLAKAAPNVEFPGYVADVELKAMAGQSKEQLLREALYMLELPRNRWQPVATRESLQSMTADQLRTFMAENTVATRTRRAETMPLANALVEAQATGDKAAIKAAAQAIVALGDKGVADFGPMFKFYQDLASA